MFKSLFVSLLALAAPFAASAQLKLQKGDRICVVGGSVADRMQHDGWLETLIQQAYPQAEIFYRDLGFSGDRVDQQPRQQNYPSNEQFMKMLKPDVIFCLFGYNESFAGKDGLDKFKKSYAALLKKYRDNNFNGKGTLRLVLFSPVANQNLHSPYLHDGKANNERLALYTQAVKEVAEAENAGFVDLYHPLLDLYGKTDKALTINGIHQNDEGGRQIAMIALEALAGKKVEAPQSLEPLRQAVLDKNEQWEQHSRCRDGNDVWGSRSRLGFVNGQTNADVLIPELNAWDVLAANRDKRIHALANGEDLKVDDSNVPPPVPVISNVGGGSKSSNAEKEGSLSYLSGKEGLAKMSLAEGYQVDLFADESMFPELANPVQMAVDTKGRLWVAAWQSYPKWQPNSEMKDALLILPDDNRDGVADRCVEFCRVENPTGFEFWNGGVIVASAPNIWYFKDTDGDDKADVKILLLQGSDSGDTHHAANNLVYGPDGGIYWQSGVFMVNNFESPWATNLMSRHDGMYRFNPASFIISFHAPNGPNSHGISFDRWGYHYATDGTSGKAFQVVPAKKGFKMRKLLEKEVRPVPSSGIVSSAQFPDDIQQDFLLCNTIGFLGIKHYKLDRNAETGEVNGTPLADFLSSSDKNFRPSDMEFGDDGALYVSDWHNVIIGHMQHNVRDPNRDHKHGRVYRITAKGRSLQEHVNIDGLPVKDLLENLKHPVDGVRYRTRIELSEYKPEEIIPVLNEWVKQFDPAKVEDAHPLLEALWLYQRCGSRNDALLARLISSPESNARIAARTVQHYWAGLAVDTKSPEVEAEKVFEPIAPSVRADGVLVVVIHTVKEQMRYDQKEFTAKPGQTVELKFVNVDLMPHNLVVTLPDTADSVCAAALAMGAEGFKAGFIPEDANVLAHTKLLDGGAEEILTFTAPDKPGDYPVVCTFPGHGVLMRAVMKVAP